MQANSVFSVSSVVNRFFLSSVCGLLTDRADAELDVADARALALFSQGFEDLLFLEGEFLDDDGVGGGDFEDAPFEPAGEGVGGERFAGRFMPRGGEVGGGLDAAVAACGDELR